MYLVQLLLPLYDNAGRRFAHQRFARVRDELTQKYGGLTAYLRSPADGTWTKEGNGAVERDEVVMFEVMVDELDRAWWSQYRRTLEQRFDQQELLVRATVVDRL